MHDSGFVGLGEALGGVLQVTQELYQVGVTGANALPQSLAIDKLHRYKMLSVNFIDFINMSDVRMIQCRGSLGFPHKTGHAILVRSHLGGQDLQGHLTIQLCILG